MQLAQRRTLTVTQSNALALSSQEMSLLEKRLLAIGIARLDASDPDLRVRLFVNEFNSVFDVSTNANYERLREGTKALMSRVVHIEQPDGGWEMFQWVNYARYVSSKSGSEGSYIDMEFSQKLAPYIHQLSKNFNSYTLEKISQMQSFYSVRIFEILHHDSFAGKKSRLEYDLDDLKFRLRLKYEEKRRQIDRYPNFKDFRVRVLEQAQRDCETHTDLLFSFEGVRRGRRIATVIFDIKRKAQPILIELPERPAETPMEQLEMADQLRQAGFMGAALETVKEYGVERVQEAIRAARKVERAQANTLKPVRNLGGLIVHMLRSGTDTLPEADSAKSLSDTRVKELAQALQSAFDDAQGAALEAYWESLDAKEQGSYRLFMRSYLDDFTLKALEGKNWQGASFRAARNSCLRATNPEVLPSHLRQVADFSHNNEFFAELPEAERARVFAYLDGP